MKYFAAILFNIVITLTFSLNAEARRDQAREARQQARIRQGVKSGELTHKEAAHLRAGQKRVDHMQEKAKEDGVVTDAEKARIEKTQDRQSEKIYKQKHDEQDKGAHE